MIDSPFARLRASLTKHLLGMAAERKPDFVVYLTDGRAYLRRWWLIPRNPLFNIYLHEFVNNDDDRALHDHPWASLSLTLAGAYMEIKPAIQQQAAGWDYMPGHTHSELRVPGDWVYRPARLRHRIEVTPSIGSAWTLFVTGPVFREWGFHCRTGWIPWGNFVDQKDKGLLGAGCEGASRKPRPWWRLFRRHDA